MRHLSKDGAKLQQKFELCNNMTQNIAQNLAYIKKKQYLCTGKGFQIPFPPVADGVINTVTYRRLLTLFATNPNLRKSSYQVVAATMNVPWVCIIHIHARKGVVGCIYGRGFRLFFYLVKGLRSPGLA